MTKTHRPATLVCAGLASMGVGLLPGPRGTYGSVLTWALALAWLGSSATALMGWGFGLLLAGLTGLAVAVSHIAEAGRIFDDKDDPGQIVIDEAVGMLIALWGQAAPISWWRVGLALAAFRFFDIVKPWPVNAAQRLPGGWGVVADDVVAGLYALGVVALANWLATG
jgi:phosphatidylglycerophosphatase A